MRDHATYPSTLFVTYLYLGYHPLCQLLLRCGGRVEVLVHDAGDEAVAEGLYAHLVEGEEGDEPGGLQDEDGGDADGAADAEHLQAGQDLKNAREENNNVKLRWKNGIIQELADLVPCSAWPIS